VLLAQGRGQELLVLWIGPGMKQADRDRRHVSGRDPPSDVRDVAVAQRLGHGAAVSHPLGDLEAQVPGHERHRLRVREVVQVGAVAPADLQNVAETTRGHKRRHRAAPLRDGVDHDRGAVDERPDLPGRHAGVRDGLQHTVAEPAGGSVNLGPYDHPGEGVQGHEVGESAADIDRQPDARGIERVSIRRGRGHLWMVSASSSAK
jgi:hypothetical protein